MAETDPSVAAPPAGLDAFCGREPALGLDRAAVLALKPEGPVEPDVALSVGGTGGTGAAGVLAFTTSGTCSGGGSCWFWFWFFSPAAVRLPLLDLAVGLFLSTELPRRPSLAEPLRCRGFWVGRVGFWAAGVLAAADFPAPWLEAVGGFRPVPELLACRDKALLLMAGSFPPPLVALGAASLGALVPEPGGFAELWLPTGSVLLLGRSSGRVPGAPGDDGAALPAAPLFSLLPSDEALRLVGNPFTGSFEAAAGRPDDPDAGC